VLVKLREECFKATSTAVQPPGKSPYGKLTPLSTQIGIDSYSLCDKITLREYCDFSRSGSESAAFFVVLVVISAMKAKCLGMMFLQNPPSASLVFLY